MITHGDEKLELPEQATGKDLAEKLNLRDPHQSLALKVGKELKDLSSSISSEKEVSLVHFDDPEGKESFFGTPLRMSSLKLF